MLRIDFVPKENENISLQHLGNLKFTYPTYFLPKFGEELRELNNEFLTNFGKLPNKIAIRAYEITLDLILRTSYRRKLIKSIDLPTLSRQLNHLSSTCIYSPITHGTKITNSSTPIIIPIALATIIYQD